MKTKDHWLKMEARTVNRKLKIERENMTTRDQSIGTIKRLAKQNKLMDLDIDYQDKLSDAELEFVANFTLELVGDRKTCERQATEEIRKANTSLRGKLRQSDCMSRLKDHDGHLEHLPDGVLASPCVSPDTQLLFDMLVASGDIKLDEWGDVIEKPRKRVASNKHRKPSKPV